MGILERRFTNDGNGESVKKDKEEFLLIESLVGNEIWGRLQFG